MDDALTKFDARALKVAGEEAFSQGEHKLALLLLDRALNVAKAVQQEALFAQIAITKADLHWNLNQLREASDLYSEALKVLEREFGEKSDVVGICLRNLGEISQEDGDSDLADFYRLRWQTIMGFLD